ncbi:protein of unknown function [Rhodovastum atsumiense]|nr:protein of unknown function [Rhodovastum atsumiense]
MTQTLSINFHCLLFRHHTDAREHDRLRGRDDPAFFSLQTKGMRFLSRRPGRSPPRPGSAITAGSFFDRYYIVSVMHDCNHAAMPPTGRLLIAARSLPPPPAGKHRCGTMSRPEPAPARRKS